VLSSPEKQVEIVEPVRETCAHLDNGRSRTEQRYSPCSLLVLLHAANAELPNRRTSIFPGVMQGMPGAADSEEEEDEDEQGSDDDKDWYESEDEIDAQVAYLSSRPDRVLTAC
jgi:hypothetical protein